MNTRSWLVVVVVAVVVGFLKRKVSDEETVGFILGLCMRACVRDAMHARQIDGQKGLMVNVEVKPDHHT